MAVELVITDGSEVAPGELVVSDVVANSVTVSSVFQLEIGLGSIGADSQVYNNTASGLSATTVKDALDELAAEKQDKEEVSNLPDPSLDLDFQKNIHSVFDEGRVIHQPSFSLLDISRNSIATGYAANNKLIGALANRTRSKFVLGQNLGIIAEPSVTNLQANSSTFTTGVNTVITPDATTSPEINELADLILEDSSNGLHYANIQTSAGTQNDRIFISCYVKDYSAGSSRSFKLITNGGGGSSPFVTFTPRTATLEQESGVDFSGFDTLPNGWFRVWYVFTAPSSATYQLVPQLVQTSTLLTSYGGDGVSGLYMYGRQFSISSDKVELVNTTAATATKLPDDITRLLGQEYNTGEFTLYAELSMSSGHPTSSSTDYVLGLMDATSPGVGPAEFIGLIKETNASTLSFLLRAGNVTDTALSFPGLNIASEDIKLAFTLASDLTYSVSLNGSYSSGNTTLDPSNLLRLLIHSDTSYAGKYVKALKLYSTALSEVQLVGLTK